MSKVRIFPVPAEIRPPVLFLNVLSTAPLTRGRSWEELVTYMRSSPRLSALTGQARRAYGVSASSYASLKRLLPVMAPAVAEMRGTRSAQAVRALTGIVPVDLDHVGSEELARLLPLVRGDVHTFVAHVTPSGHGLRILMPYAADGGSVAYQDAWEQCNQYAALLTGLSPDPATKDVARLSYLCHDGEAYFNPAAHPLCIVPMHKEQQRHSALLGELAAVEDPFGRAERLAQRGGLQFRPGMRHTFLVSLLCYLNKMGVPEEEAVAHLETRYGSYDEERMSRLAATVYGPYSDEHGTWTHVSHAYAAPFPPSALRAGRAERGAGSGNGAGARPGSAAAGTGKGTHAGLAAAGTAAPSAAPAGALPSAAPAGTLPEAAPEAAAPEAAAAPDPADRAARIILNRQTLRSFILSHYNIRYNSVKDCLELRDGEQDAYVSLDGRRIRRIYNDCGDHLPFRFSNSQVDDVLYSNYIPEYNPLTGYLAQLAEYTPATMPDHIGAFVRRVHLAGDSAPATRPLPAALEDCRTHADLFDLCFRKWFVAMLACWIYPGVTNEVVLILIGGQGVGKSTFFEHLLPPQLQQQYFLKNINNGYMGKDDRLSLTEFGLMCFEELDSMDLKDLNRTKALITTKVISERAAYARTKSHRNHIASFCGTGNNAQFLTDLTGNRRWLPFEVTAVTRPEDEPIDYDGLYSQAYHMLRSGYRYWFSTAENKALESHLEPFRAPNFLEEEITRLYHLPSADEEPRFISNSDIADSLSQRLQRTVTGQAIGMMMRHMGYEARRDASGNRGYMVAFNRLSAAPPRR